MVYSDWSLIQAEPRVHHLFFRGDWITHGCEEPPSRVLRQLKGLDHQYRGQPIGKETPKNKWSSELFRVLKVAKHSHRGNVEG